MVQLISINTILIWFGIITGLILLIFIIWVAGIIIYFTKNKFDDYDDKF
jgi:uncharacterized SAM-binding protein YcdF (DUF218 family)